MAVYNLFNLALLSEVRGIIGIFGIKPTIP